MNPFLYDTVARPAPCADFPAAPGASGRHAGREVDGQPKAQRGGLFSQRLRRRRFTAGTAGRLAAAGGLALAMASSAHALDVNSASAEQLEALRGVGPKTARIIVQERQRGGRFESIEDLSDRVRGIGPKRARALQAAGLGVDGGAAPGPAAGGGSPRSAPPRQPGRP